jgi:glycosyltransferase involved in cell wall biosynthesis
MNVLVVGVLGAHRGGSSIRLAMTVEALSRLADVHLFVVANDDLAGDVPGADHAVRVATALRRRPPIPAQAVRWLTRPSLPDHLARFDLTAAADALRAFVPRERRLTWLCQPAAWLLARTAGVPGPTVCDLDDLEDFRQRSIDALRAVGEARPPELGGAAGVARRLRGQVDAGRWRRWRRTVAAEALPVLCSDLERRRSGLTAAAVVPNGYGVDPPCGPSAPGVRVPTAVFVGSFHYLPNRDGARWLAAAIAPELRRLDPAATVRLVGPGPAEMTRLAQGPGVSWAGPVADVGPELRSASVALVPLRAGSGTRVKILEAWAHGVPVVSTPLGAEGLDARDGEEVLLATTASGLARAVLEAGADDALRRRLIEGGRARWRAAHTPDAIADAVATVVARALQSSSGG